MRHPTLRQVEADLERVRSLTPKLAEAAKWAWPMAYSRVRHAHLEGAAGETARPVEAAVATEGAPEWVVRSEVGRAGILIGRALELLLEAGACLRRAQLAADVRAPAPDMGADIGRPLISKGELAGARRAKARRDAQRPPGVGYGEY